MSYISDVTAILEALPEDATAEEVATAVRHYSRRDVAAAMYALNSAGGGLPDPITTPVRVEEESLIIHRSGNNFNVVDESLVVATSGLGGNALVLSGNGYITLAATETGATYLYALGDVTPLELGVNTGQTAPIMRAYDEDFNEVFRIDANGSVHIKTGTSIVADL